jgi:hypothetical protein
MISIIRVLVVQLVQQLGLQLGLLLGHLQLVVHRRALVGRILQLLWLHLLLGLRLQQLLPPSLQP